MEEKSMITYGFIKCVKCSSFINFGTDLCPQCGEDHSSRWKNLLSESYICPQCGNEEYSMMEDLYRCIARFCERCHRGEQAKFTHDGVRWEYLSPPLASPLPETQTPTSPAFTQPIDPTPKCPTCGSNVVQKIGAMERGASIAGLGIFSRKINKSFKCKSCGHTW